MRASRATSSPLSASVIGCQRRPCPLGRGCTGVGSPPRSSGSPVACSSMVRRYVLGSAAPTLPGLPTSHLDGVQDPRGTRLVAHPLVEVHGAGGRSEEHTSELQS